jgi:hypothetical protein
VASGLRELTRTLKSIRPPAEVAKAHRGFTTGLAVFSSRMAKVTAALRAGDRAKAKALLTTLSARKMPSAVVINTKAAQATFKRLGYDLGPQPVP